MQKITINTTKENEVIDLTRVLNDLFVKNLYDKGVAFLFATHSSCALTTANLDPGTDLDMIDAFKSIVPNLQYRHAHNPAHAPDHIMSSIIGPSLTVTLQSGSMVLGQNQRVVLVELNGPKERRINITFLPEPEK